MENIINLDGRFETVTTFVDVNTNYFKDEFIIDKGTFEFHLDYYKNKLIEDLTNYTYYKLFRETFNQRIMIWGNETNLACNVTFDFANFKRLIQIYLSTEKILDTNHPDFEKQIIERLALLKNIKTEEKLLEEFPNLYYIYIEGNKESNNVSNKYFYDCGLRLLPEDFAKEQVTFFANTLANMSRIRTLFANSSVMNDAIKNNVDMKKLNLYIAYKLTQIIADNKPRKAETISKAKQALEHYFINITEEDAKTKITLEDGSTLSYYDLATYHYKVTNGLKFKISWRIFPPKHDKNREFHQPVNFTPMSDERFNELYELNKIKCEYYLSKENECLGIGTAEADNIFDCGYHAFFFRNGEIILDKLCFPDEKYVVSQYGNAIYNLNIYNFLLFSHISRLEMRKQLLHHYTTHRGNWQKRVDAMINKTKTTTETIENTKKLIKSINEKSK